MCLLVLAWQAHPRYRLIVAANRDEFHDRPAAPLARWSDPQGMIAGRDLRAGGTWLAIDDATRFGVVTNFRDLQRPRPGAPSRGELIPEYLRGRSGPQTFLESLASRAKAYSGFNLLLADGEALWYASNRAETFSRPLSPGIYGLSNHLLDEPWPKLVRVKQRFEHWLRANDGSTEEALFEMLRDEETALPDASPKPHGISPELERALSAPFVKNASYGTRCSTVTLISSSGGARIAERRFDAAGALTGATAFEIDGS